MTSPISSAALAQMQALTNATMDETFTQKRNSPTQGPTRNTIDNYATLGALTGHLAQPSPQLLQNYDFRVAAQSAWLVRLPIGTDIRVSDRLVTTDGQQLDVQVVLAPRSYDVAIRCLAAEVR